MLTKSFGKLGWPVSAVGLGAWNIGNQWGEIDDATAWATVRAAYHAGMTLFDVAESYGFPNGLSEMRVGQALSGIRHNVILVSKIGNWGGRTGGAIPKTGVDSIRISGHAILGRLRTDWVDVILCHKGDLGDRLSTWRGSKRSRMRAACAPMASRPTTWMYSSASTGKGPAVSCRWTTRC